MGWCSGTYLFDKTVDMFIDFTEGIGFDPEMYREMFVYELVHEYWNYDWDCEPDSKHYELIIDAFSSLGEYCNVHNTIGADCYECETDGLDMI